MKQSGHSTIISGQQNSHPWIGIAVGIGLALVMIGFILLQNRTQSAGASSVIQMTGTTLNNTRVSLEDLRGQVVMVNFWATWCPPCRSEMPTIQAAYKTYRDQGFTVLAVNASETPNTIQPFVQQMGLTFPIVLDQNEAIQRQFGIDGFPTSLFIDPNGVLYATHNGPISPAQLTSTIETGLTHRQR
jgi:thiol-disulfide isomerase/thioredoxin